MEKGNQRTWALGSYDTVLTDDEKLSCPQPIASILSRVHSLSYWYTGKTTDPLYLGDSADLEDIETERKTPNLMTGRATLHDETICLPPNVLAHFQGVPLTLVGEGRYVTLWRNEDWKELEKTMVADIESLLSHMTDLKF